MHLYRSHNCGALRAGDVGQDVRLSGWVHRKRDHGGVLFVDLRDHYGLTQIVADADSPALAVLEGLRLESVVTIDGVVKARSAATVNPNLPSGEIEVFARVATVLSRAEELPLPVAGEQEYPVPGLPAPPDLTSLSAFERAQLPTAARDLGVIARYLDSWHRDGDAGVEHAPIPGTGTAPWESAGMAPAPAIGGLLDRHRLDKEALLDAHRRRARRARGVFERLFYG